MGDDATGGGGPAAGLPGATTAESLGISSGAVLDFLDAIEQAGLDPHSLMLVRHDRVAAAGWWAPYRPDDLTLKYSLSKSFTCTAVGFAVAEGHLELDGTLAGYFPGAAAGPLARAIRVRDLMAMATGHELDTLDRLDPGDPVGSFLALEPESPPGTLFTYNNGATLMLSVLITHRTGQDVSDYLRPRLMSPLGIDRMFWQRTGAYQQGFSGLHLTTASIARLGQTYLRGGAFHGRPVLPSGWAALASALHTANAGRTENVDWQQGYGFGFWRSRHGFRGDGAAGQFCLMLPEQDLVLASTGAMDDMQGYLELVWRVLLPGVAEAGLPADPAAASRLADRLSALSLPLPDADGAGPARGMPTAVHPVASPTVPPAVSPAVHPAVSPAVHPAVSPAAELVVHGDPAAVLGLTGASVQGRPGAWTLVLIAAGERYRLPLTSDRFTRAEFEVGGGVLTLAAGGGWQSDGRFTADVVLVNTPHRFRITGDPSTGRADTAWHVAPLEPLPLTARAIMPTGGVA